MDPMSTSVYNHNEFTPVNKCLKRKRLRRLVQQKDDDDTNAQSATLKFALLLSVLAAIASAGALYSNSRLWNDFRNSYKEQYNLIVHGTQDYCVRNIKTAEMVARIRKKVIGQEGAIDNLAQTLQNRSTFQSIALHGQTGIGKTHLSELLLANFPWQENIQRYIWSTYATDVEKLQTIESFLDNVSDCGDNLIVIDDLLPKDSKLIQDYNQMVETRTTVINERRRPIKLIVIYIFNLPTYSNEQRENHERDSHVVENLDRIQTIRLRMLNQTDLEECIKLESTNLNVSLLNEQFDDIVKSIDVHKAGCKTVYSKVRLYTQL